MANSAVASKYVAYFGMDLESCSVWRLIGRRLKVFFRPGVRKKLYGRDRNLTISRGQMRLVLPFRRFVLGPTVLIGYQGGGEETMRFEEFFLCTVGDNQVRTPTADADGWARDLGLPEAPAALRRLVQGRRTAVRRRLALADLGVAALVSGAILFILAGTYAVILATEAGAARGAMLFGTLAGVWAVTMALCTACHLYCHR
jgi:hypothetical protein